LRAGTERAKAVTQGTLDEVRAALGTFSFDAAARNVS
jgi:tryptophanyl-tRNA synthetase